MKRFAALLLALALACAQALAAGTEVEFHQAEQDFMQGDKLIYRYACSYPQLKGESFAVEAVNHYYLAAVSEMTELVLPMYAADPDMAGDGNRVMKQAYEITCNNGAFFSTLMRQQQGDVGAEQVSLSSQVFAMTGVYAGESLTLRGLLGEIGESSDQLAAVVLKDIWRQIEPEIRAANSPWDSRLTLEALSLDFFPQEHFYADGEGRAVFYLQPGLFRSDGESPTYAYSAEDVLRLLKENQA